MKRENLDKLYKRYPVILERCSINCGDGWFTILDVLLSELQSRADQEKDPQPVAMQIKEKWGELRVYIKGATDSQGILIDFARESSLRICDVCAHPGDLLKNSGFFRVRCSEHSEHPN